MLSDLELAQQLKNLLTKSVASKVASSTITTQIISGTAQSDSADSSDGKTVSVLLDAAVVVGDDQDQAMTLPTNVSVETGDTVQVTCTVQGSSVTSMIITGVTGRGTEVATTASDAQATAETAVTTAKDAATITITSTHGLVFKSNAISTTLIVTVYQPGGNKITDLAGLKAAFGSSARIEWGWQREDEDGWSTILASDSRLSNDGFALSVSPADVDARTSFEASVVTD